MAMNLRLRPEAEEALRTEAERSHRSQQEILRDALDRYLGLAESGFNQVDDLIASGVVRPPRVPYRRVTPDPATAGGPAVVIDRDDRF